MHSITRVITIGLVFWASLAQAHEHWRPRTIDELKNLSGAVTPQDHVFIPGTEIAEINFIALRRDFKFMRTMSDEDIRSYILYHYARISLKELRLRGIRVDMFTYDPTNVETWFHPSGYLRAAMAEVRNGEIVEGLIDIKGTGQSSENQVLPQERFFATAMAIEDPEKRQAELDKLRTRDHSDGVMTLGEAIAESERQKSVQAGFDLFNAAHGTSWQTVETYFIRNYSRPSRSEGVLA